MRVKIISEKQVWSLEMEINKFIESIEETHTIENVDMKVSQYGYYALIRYEVKV